MIFSTTERLFRLVPLKNQNTAGIMCLHQNLAGPLHDWALREMCRAGMNRLYVI